MTIEVPIRTVGPEFVGGRPDESAGLEAAAPRLSPSLSQLFRAYFVVGSTAFGMATLQSVRSVTVKRGWLSLAEVDEGLGPVIEPAGDVVPFRMTATRSEPIAHSQGRSFDEALVDVCERRGTALISRSASAHACGSIPGVSRNVDPAGALRAHVLAPERAASVFSLVGRSNADACTQRLFLHINALEAA